MDAVFSDAEHVLMRAPSAGDPEFAAAVTAILRY